MPKLNQDQQKAASEAKDDGGFVLLPEGRYLGTLAEVEVLQGNEYDYWNCTFRELMDESGKVWPGRQWDKVSMSPKSDWKVKQFFEAMGYTLDSDTDEMIGDKCVLHISQGIQEKGKNAGKMTNNVDRLAPYDKDEWADALAAAGADSSGPSGGRSRGSDDF